MDQIPLPSLIHYELLLQLLERKTFSTVEKNPALREPVQQLIITLRKAFAQQRQIETICEQGNIPYEHRWSLNTLKIEPELLPEILEVIEDDKTENREIVS
ncbi:DUF5340 domain-containing protein [Spirulina sp. 06S082]|uniref:DUF5340 domain-containing protein n=1 Tax=Spirulina sp. 06S082 TaxID=3110248 RepID=UPI002B1E9DF2|nr:DUF5340 domain-containing protein [Spirulina sp. 06S082]MEA5468730.1 DUF5340 domain-containing protein [Spirulina sp. 06S082]